MFHSITFFFIFSLVVSRIVSLVPVIFLKSELHWKQVITTHSLCFLLWGEK